MSAPIGRGTVGKSGRSRGPVSLRPLAVRPLHRRALRREVGFLPPSLLFGLEGIPPNRQTLLSYLLLRAKRRTKKKVSRFPPLCGEKKSGSPSVCGVLASMCRCPSFIFSFSFIFGDDDDHDRNSPISLLMRGWARHRHYPRRKPAKGMQRGSALSTLFRCVSAAKIEKEQL